MAQLKPRIKALERDQARRKRPREIQLSFAFGDAPEALAREGEAVARFDFCPQGAESVALPKGSRDD